MARIPPPLPLTTNQYKAKIKQLQKEGKPLTMTNIDPRFMKWIRDGQTMDKCVAYGLMIGVILIILALLIPKMIFIISEVFK